MATDLDRLRSEIRGKLEPPVDVMIDSSLVVSSASLERLMDSAIFEAQTQATLDETLRQPRIGSLFMPASFYELIEKGDQIDLPTTATWSFYRGQAKGATSTTIADILDSHDIRSFDDQWREELDWEMPLDESERSDLLISILEETLAFLAEGGVLISRTTSSVDAFRDAGIPSINLGRAEVDPEVLEPLTDLGFRNPASISVFGITSTGITRSLVGDLLTHHSELLLYRFGG